MEDYNDLSLEELARLKKQTETLLININNRMRELEKMEHDKIYKSVKVYGCAGCDLEYYGWNNSCDHCEGWHYEEVLRNDGEMEKLV